MIELSKVTKLTKVSKIVHIADVHIRNLRRHTEYSIQFEKLYSLIKKSLDENTLIYVAGDIVHTKTDMSPELISMTSKFLSSLADIAPTIVIAGNHDANLNNPDRLDAISPIIENLNHKNLFYLKDTGLYLVGDIVFSVMSVFDTPDKFILANDINVDLTKIALYHGPVTTSVTSIGYNIHGAVDMSIFDNYDYALLGDIHMHQYLNDTETIAYASSLIQQNFGEEYNNHGFILWDMQNKTHEFIHIDNDYGFHTLTVLNGKLLPYDESLITKKSRVRVKSVNTTQEVLQETISKLKSDLHLPDISIVKLDTMSHGTPIDISKTNNIDIRNVDVQNNLIKEFLNVTSNLDLSPDLLEKIYDINRKTNLLLSSADEIIRNIIWKPKKFTYSNMFSYGEGNVINFESLSGIQGLFGPNASGKSSLLDALCFCLFDTTSRAYKADQIINTKSNRFTCQFNFEIDGVDYFIEKYGVKNPRGKVAVKIDFWSVDALGNKKSLNGEDRRKTNAAIRSYIGTYEDFTLMCLSIQSNNTNFVDKAQTERKEILAKFLDLNILDSLYELANIEYKKLNILIDDTNAVELENIIDDLKTKLIAGELEYNKLLLDFKTEKEHNADIHKKIITTSAKIIPTFDLDKDKLVSDLDAETIKKSTLITKLDTILSDKRDIDDSITKAESELAVFDFNKITTDSDLYDSLKNDIFYKKIAIEKLELKLKTKKEKLAQLSEHKYDPECYFCINNVFVKDAIQTESDIKVDLLDLDKATAEMVKLQNQQKDVEYAVQSLNDYNDIQKRISELNSKMSDLEIAKLSVENSILLCKSRIIEINKSLDIFKKNQEAITANVEYSIELDKLNADLKNSSDLLDEMSDKTMKIYSNNKIIQNKIDDTQILLDKIRQLIFDRAAYTYYLSSVGKDGISYQLISKVIPKIESEINTILSNLVDFNILLYANGKNVDAYMVYGKDHWPLELSSGMERFISSIAIRVALINISSLPKPTFFAIDEGLGVLDSSNLNQMYLLFNYIRDVFQFTLIISHIDVVKDMVDSTLTVEVENGFSKLEIL